MDSVEPDSDSSLRSARNLGYLFFIYAIALPFVSIILPESGNYITSGGTIISWVLILMMPMEILLVYLIYWTFRRTSGSFNIMSLAIPMYLVATTPSIYVLIIGMINPPFRYIAAPVGLLFSLVSLWLAIRFLPNLQK